MEVNGLGAKGKKKKEMKEYSGRLDTGMDVPISCIIFRTKQIKICIRTVSQASSYLTFTLMKQNVSG